MQPILVRKSTQKSRLLLPGKGLSKLTTTSPSGPKGVSQTDDDNCRQPLPPSAKNKTTTVAWPIWYPGHPLSNEGDVTTLPKVVECFELC